MTKSCSIPGCEKRVRARGWCSTHYSRWERFGDPLAKVRAIAGDGEPERFFREALTYDGTDCLLWPFGRDSRGYGSMEVDGVIRRVHSRVCEETHGPAPSPDHEAAHSCGKGHEGCVTKGHLSWKTHAENMVDMVEHGTSLRGLRNPRAKLTETEVRQILALKGKRTQQTIADQFGVGRAAISHIMNGTRWAWLQ